VEAPRPSLVKVGPTSMLLTGGNGPPELLEVLLFSGGAILAFARMGALAFGGMTERLDTSVAGFVMEAVYGICRKKREPTSGLEPLSCSLRVIIHALQGCAGGCKYPSSKGISLLCLAEGCTVLRSRWYQSGINRGIAASRSCSVEALI